MTDIVERLRQPPVFAEPAESDRLRLVAEEAADLITALRAEVASKNEQFQQYARKMEADMNALAAQNETLRAALRNCISLLDGLVAESGRSIEWGEEDPFRMGEWFEPEDLAQIEEARAALEETKHE